MHSMDHYFDLEPVGDVVVVRIGDQELLRSTGAVRLLEFNQGRALPPVIYFPRADVPVDQWEKSGLTTGCAIKGRCEYWSIDAAGQRKANVAWSYTNVTKDGERIKDWVAFDKERVTIETAG